MNDTNANPADDPIAVLRKVSSGRRWMRAGVLLDVESPNDDLDGITVSIHDGDVLRISYSPVDGEDVSQKYRLVPIDGTASGALTQERAWLQGERVEWYSESGEVARSGVVKRIGSSWLTVVTDDTGVDAVVATDLAHPPRCHCAKDHCPTFRRHADHDESPRDCPFCPPDWEVGQRVTSITKEYGEIDGTITAVDEVTVNLGDSYVVPMSSLRPAGEVAGDADGGA